MLPYSTLGFRDLDPPAVPQDVAAAYAHGLNELLKITPPDEGFDLIQLSFDARYLHREYAQQVETDLRPGERFEYATDWAGKLPGAVARLAGLLHCVVHGAHAANEPLAEETMANAIKLAAPLAAHALILLDLMGADPAKQDARKVYALLERRPDGLIEPGGFVTSRALFEKLKGGLRTMPPLRAAIGALVEYGWLREAPAQHGGPGRPSERWEVHPLLTGTH